MKKILLIETSDIGAAYTAEAVKELGYEPVFLCNLKEYSADPLAQIQRYAHFDCDTSSLENVLEKIREQSLEDSFAVVSTADIRLRVAFEVSQHLGIAGLDPAVVPLKDKAWVAGLIPEYSPPSVSFSGSKLPYIDIVTLFQDGKNRVIVKPVSGAGGFATLYLNTIHDLAQLEQRLNQQNVPHSMGKGEWIAQTVAIGELVSVEGFVARGEMRILGISNRKKIGCTESGASFPVDNSISLEARSVMTQACEALVKRAGFTRGYFHIEFMVNENEAWLIDANMGRVGGGAIAEQLATAFALAPTAIFRHLLKITLFPDEPNFSPYQNTPQATLALLYGIDHPDRLLRLNLPASFSGFHTQILGNGSNISAMGTNDWAWIGIVSGLKDDVEKTIDKISIQTEKGEFAPSY